MKGLYEEDKKGSTCYHHEVSIVSSVHLRLCPFDMYPPPPPLDEVTLSDAAALQASTKAKGIISIVLLAFHYD